MRWEVEVMGVVLRVTLGPEVEEWVTETAPERLHVADASHAGYHEDPVFPDLDWGDDDGRSGVDLGHGRQRKPDTPVRYRPEGFGFGGER